MDLSTNKSKSQLLSSTRRERRQKEIHERLLNAATKLFVAQGYEKTSVAEIAELADVARTTAFNYFPSKEDYLVAWVDTRRETFKGALTDEASNNLQTQDRLLRAFTSLARVYEKDSDTSRPMVREWLRAGGPLIRQAWSSSQIVGDLIADGQIQGSIREDIDPVQVGSVIVDVYYGTLYRWASEANQSPDLVAAVSRAIELVLAAISKKGDLE